MRAQLRAAIFVDVLGGSYPPEEKEEENLRTKAKQTPRSTHGKRNKKTKVEARAGGKQKNKQNKQPIARLKISIRGARSGE